jgi:peptidoglycan/LPS O-acetylase OafA/YrhL
MVVLSLFLQQNSWLARSLSIRPMVFIGKISYGVYLFHMLILRLAAHSLHRGTGSLSNGKQDLLAVLLVLGGSVIMAWLHYNMVERRFLALRDRPTGLISRLVAGNRPPDAEAHQSHGRAASA